MGIFTEGELVYLREQKLGRMATTGADGAPHVVPVGFAVDEATGAIDIIGYKLTGSKKFRDLSRDPRIAFVVDDVLPPWQPRGIEIRGTAQLLLADDPAAGVARDTIRVIPQRISGWGIDTDPYQRNSRTVQPAP
jgi:pyridoxamine 5'-phosphate oxidase family protein